MVSQEHGVCFPNRKRALDRFARGHRLGPVREVQAGSGYWSQNSAVQVLGGSDTATGVCVRWPGGKETTVPLPPGSREIVVRKETTGSEP